MQKTYIAIDLKSFYASVECMERHVNPLTTNLVVADNSRTEKTICLAVSPSLKLYGVPGRPRLFEVNQMIRDLNKKRLQYAPNKTFVDDSFDYQFLASHPDYKIDFIVAPPQMAKYIEISSTIYETYLTFVSKDDIHVYSIDEVFIDVTPYLDTYQMSAHELTLKMVQAVFKRTGITATAGIGTNLYLAKVAMDIVAKHIEPDEDGVRIAQLDEYSYRELLWNHRPLIDFWRVGRGYSKKLEAQGMFTMGDVARCSLENEELLYRLFGINAELLIDHAWGIEPCTMQAIKNYKPNNHSFGAGQVLHAPYPWHKARIIVKEMGEALALDMLEKQLVTNKIVLSVGYDKESLNIPEIRDRYDGPVTTDYYGRSVPKGAHGTQNLEQLTSSATKLVEGLLVLFDKITNKGLFIRRISMSFATYPEGTTLKPKKQVDQLDLFTDYEAIDKQKQEEAKYLEKERKEQEALLKIKQKFGKNAVLKATSLLEGATAKERNNQIGGHKK